MKNKHSIFLILIIFAFAFALSGCKGGSSKPPSPASSSASSPASSGAAKTSSVSSLSPGLWKMTVRTTAQMPSMAGRPPMNHTSGSVVTTCIKPDSKQTKPYMPTPKNFKCDNVKESIGADGSIHWSMHCTGKQMDLTSKGITKITANHFKSHVASVENMKTNGFSMKSIMDVRGKRISNKCPSKS